MTMYRVSPLCATAILTLCLPPLRALPGTTTALNIAIIYGMYMDSFRRFGELTDIFVDVF